MPGSSINTRLWFTYIFIIILVLVIAFAGIVLAFRRSPLLYRQVFYRISLISDFLKDRLAVILKTQWDAAIHLFLEEIGYFDVYIAILNNQGDVLLKSGIYSNAGFPDRMDPAVLENRSQERIFIYRDRNRQDWFYQVVEINDTYSLLTAAPRPEISLASLFQDELMKPLFRAGLIALLIAFVLG